MHLRRGSRRVESLHFSLFTVGELSGRDLTVLDYA